MANGENMEEGVVFDQMRREERWRELLDKTRSVTTVAMAGLKSTFPSPSWMHFGTVNVNHGWMTTVDEKTGYGNIRREDFVKLLESHGFKVADAKDLTLEYKLSKKFSEGFRQNTILSAFPEIVGVEREEFLQEFLSRADQLKKIVSLIVHCKV